MTLIAVSKTHPATAVIDAAAAGLRHFGENRVEEAAKMDEVGRTVTGLTWHMIGHVQSRKAREIPLRYQWVHSVDSVKIAERYSRFAVESDSTLDVLLEMNVSGEASKEGFRARDWENNAAIRGVVWDAAKQIMAFPGLRVRGLMTVAPIVETVEQARPTFVALRRLRDALASDLPSPVDSGKSGWDTLSMGMTDDFPLAIEEGATQIRIGRAIFGPRESK